MKSQKLTIALFFAIFAITLCAATAFLSDIVAQHTDYKTYYNISLREPDSVSWNLTPSMVACKPPTRKDMFHADPSIPDCATPADYANSGYDKGHLFSYDDAACSADDRIECFYMSNMLPQIHPFNAGDWKNLEVQERAWAKTQTIHIVAGGYGSLGKLKAGENIPAYMWKAIHMAGKWQVWIMPNLKTSAGHKYPFWLSKITTFDLMSIGNEIKREKI